MIDEGISLSRQLGLRVLDQEATLAVAAELTPLDEEARALFALDHAVGHLLAVPPQRLSPHNLHAAVEDAKAEFGHDVATDDVRGELWRRGHFVRVYSLREADDFPYD
jgi:predicted exporter